MKGENGLSMVIFSPALLVEKRLLRQPEVSQTDVTSGVPCPTYSKNKNEDKLKDKNLTHLLVGISTFAARNTRTGGSTRFSQMIPRTTTTRKLPRREALIHSYESSSFSFFSSLGN